MKVFKNIIGSLVRFSQAERVAVVAIAVAVVIVCAVAFWSQSPLIIRNLSPVATDKDARTSPKRDSLFYFDPNTISEADLGLLGFSTKQIRTIVKYRTSGAVFRKAEDFARCYAVSEAKFKKLKPFIKIVSAKPQVERQSLKNESEGVVSNLNNADLNRLISIQGIGQVIATRIVEYRERLGGFVKLEQLAEVYGMDDERISECRKYFFVNNSDIKKIDINFATAKHLGEHPYMSKSLVGRVLKHRELKGGWNNITEMKREDILLPHEAEKLEPYLVFRSNSCNLNPL